MTALDIIDEVRESLGDSLGNGWDLRRLLFIVGSGQRDICKEAKLIKEQHILQLVNGRHTYGLPEECMEVTRFEHQSERVDVSTRDKLDTAQPYAGSFTVMTDKLGMGLVEISPTPEEVPELQTIVVGPTDSLAGLTLTSVFGVSSGIDSPYIFSLSEGLISGDTTIVVPVEPSPFGGLFVFSALDTLGVTQELGIVVGVTEIALEDTESGIFGVVTGTNMFDVDSMFGVVVSALSVEQYITVYYNSAPNRIGNVNDRLVLPDLWFDAMVFYTIGMALSDDNDSANLSRGEKFFGYYDREVKKAKKLSSGSFSSTQSSRKTHYRGIKE